ncbi:MAG: GerAB/ArcD/ProY family transporter [Carboxydocellales bacterium]
MLEGGKISSKQLMLLVITFIIATAILFLPAFPTKLAGQDAWLSVLLAGAIGLLVALTVTTLGLRFPNQTLMEYSEEIIGTWPGKFIGLLFILFYLHLTSIVIREISLTVIMTLLSRTPLEVAIVTVTLVTAFTVRYGLEVITRVNIICLVVNFAAMLLVILMLVKEMHLEYLTPVLSKGVLPIIQGSITPAGWFGEVCSVAFLLPFVNQPKEARKATIIGLLWVIIGLTTIVMVTIATFGPVLTPLFIFPTLQAVRLINVAEFFQRLESILLLAWLLANFVKISVFYYITVLITAQWFKLSDYKPIVLPIGIILALLALTLFRNVLEVAGFLQKVWGIYALPIEWGVPLMLLVIAVIRKKGRG